jgi:hypothetical protein
MKRVKDLEFFKNIRQIREFEFGVFYYFEGLVISEMKEGVELKWYNAKQAVEASQDFFGKNAPITYISNRINNYSIVATDWVKFFKNRQQLANYAVVGQTQSSFASLVLERMFFKKSIVQFQDLEEAIRWGLSKSNSTHVPAAD